MGLLGAFSLKVGGLNPDIFSDSVQPTIDVYDQYLAMGELQEKILFPAFPLAASFSQAFAVPAGKCWRVIAASLATTLNAADVALKSNISVAIVAPNSAPATVILGNQVDASGAPFRAFGYCARPPLFLPAGWSVSVGWTLSAAPTVAANWSVGVLVQEFDA